MNFVSARTGLAAACAAVATGLVLVACTSQVSGTPDANQAQVTEYKKEVTSSSKAAASSAAAATSSKRATALVTACTSMQDATRASTAKYNDFIAALDANAPDMEAKRTAAAGALRDGANTVDGVISSDLNDDVSAAMRDVVAKENGLADAVERRVPVAPLNAAATASNDAKNAALDKCP
ncbi:hypothetical protein JGU71_23555 [Antrihabitans sp. YC3-6]|uniref:Secreted protein n=1 Tax=Antrihabitans stalagmiti TaxID=2799499 RepID=A0A934U5W0_9NOCA|nr:hypothetical protein [Antrihabitans stalagmiti]MBJ8341866.1 hypothetical protein [Antrihabitans stalagmiti]